MNLDEYSVFRKNKKSLQHTSRDSSKIPIQFMTNNSIKAVDFDAVKTEIVSKQFYEKDDIARSADALVSICNDMYMIEFKNGEFDAIEISQKANNSIVLFNLVTSKQIDYTRKYISFVLVYSKEAKKIKNMAWQDQIALHKAIRGKTGIKLMGTDKLKGFLYKDVYMIEKDEIDDFINNRTQDMVE